MAPTRIPGVTYAAMPKAGTKASALPWPPRLVVIHDTGNNTSNAAGEASYAATRSDASSKWTSAHAYVDPDRVVGSLPLNLQAWAAYSYANRYGFHLELCRTAAGTAAATRTRAADIVRWLCEQADIPMVKLTPQQVAAGKEGICGHLDITVGLGVGDHTDPGPAFPWTEFMAQVTQQNAAGGGDVQLDGAQAQALMWADARTRAEAEDTPTYKDPANANATHKGVQRAQQQSADLATIKTDVGEIKTAVGDLGTGGVSQDQINAAVRTALTDPVVISALVDAINDDAARRMAD